MSKILEIESCSECPINRNCTIWRGYLKGHIDDNGLILKDCPLPDIDAVVNDEEKKIWALAQRQLKRQTEKRVIDEVIDYVDNNIETNWDTGIDYVDSDELVKYFKQKYGVRDE